MIKFEFSKFKQVISMTQYFYVEVYWKLHGTIFMSILWIYHEQMEDPSNIKEFFCIFENFSEVNLYTTRAKNCKLLHILSLYYIH